jgi:sec-independent protein translocase protein TatA
MSYTLAIGGNPTAWLGVVLLVLFLFGANRIPEMMRSLGSGMKEFKKGLDQDDEDEKSKSDTEGG